ncbi:MAG: beta-N-acetylhexosaminidase [Rhodocyclaceae bacterium]|nr:beta-N-acetylhexosaminidase [Rhodocyclaceae bacterium]
MNTLSSRTGPVMLDLPGKELTAEDRELLCQPLVGGVILFSRNYETPEQLRRLTGEIHALREPPLLIAVDHEGGRVQRFREGFTRLPAMRILGRIWDQDREKARQAAHAVGFVLAAELRAGGVDLSFTPVLDLDFGLSTVIGDRALHRKPEAVARLAESLIEGLALAGMAAVGKHFPGHGHVAADSHVAIPVDERNIVELAGSDLAPYKLMGGKLGGVMPAHVIYDQVDRGKPAGFSSFWLKQVLRGELHFEGAIFSDDLSMAGAKVAGGIVQRAGAAWDAGCDVVLVCNDRAAALELVAGWQPAPRKASEARLLALMPRIPAPTLDSDGYRAARELVAALAESA